MKKVILKDAKQELKLDKFYYLQRNNNTDGLLNELKDELAYDIKSARVMFNNANDYKVKVSKMEIKLAESLVEA